MTEDFSPQTPPPPPPPVPNSPGPAGYAAPYGAPPSPYPPNPYVANLYAAASPYGYQPPPRRSPWFYISIIGGSIAAVFLLITLMAWVTIRTATGSSASLNLGINKIAVMDIDGVILDAEKVDSQLRKF